MSGTFDRIVCGVDGSAAAVHAARQAGRVAPPEGELVLVAADDESLVAHAGWNASSLAVRLGEQARAAVEAGRAALSGVHDSNAIVVEGRPVDVLFAEASGRAATLLVLGSHGHSRAAGIALGSVVTAALHEAPCSVLVARAAADDDAWPRGIVVGVDGSPGSAAALDAARALGDRLGIRVRPLVALADSHVDLDAARALAPGLEEYETSPAVALEVASERADLVVVGSRGPTGRRALGSVGERVGHRAHCSVLVVRGTR